MTGLVDEVCPEAADGSIVTVLSVKEPEDTVMSDLVKDAPSLNVIVWKVTEAAATE